MKRPILSAVMTALLLSALAAPCLHAQPAASGWPMFMHDARRTGLGTVAGPDKPTLLWSYHCWGAGSTSLQASCAVGPDSGAYLGSPDNTFYAFNSSGTIAWSYATGGGFIWSSPALGSDGRSYIGSSDNVLYVFTSDGSVAWTYNTANDLYTSPALGTDGTVYISSENRRFYAFTSSGQVLWSYMTDSQTDAPPAVGSDGTVYAGSGDNNLYALTSGGALRWSYLSDEDILKAAAVGTDGRIYYPTTGNTLYALDSGGTLAWSCYFNTWVSNASCALGGGGRIVIGSSNCYLYSFDTNGSVAWSYCTGNGIVSSAALDSGGRVYFGSRDFRLYSLNPNGAFLWSYRAGTQFFANAPAIGPDGRIHITNNDNNLYVFEGPPTATPTITPTPTHTPTLTPTRTPTPLPPAQVMLNGAFFGSGNPFTATFQLNEEVTRVFDAYAVVNLPDGSMLDATTLTPSIKPLATNVNGLPAGFTYPLMSLTIPPGAPKGDCSVMVGFFAPGQPIHGPGDAFLLATTPFVLK